MANGLNRAYLLGNLGQDPELRVTQGGLTILTLSLACNESWLDKNRVRQERVEWVRVVVFGRRAEALAKFLKKGAKLFVEGSLKHSSYEDREGVKRYKTEVVAHNVILGGGAKARKAPTDPEHRRPGRDDHYGEGDGGADQNYNPGPGLDDGGGFNSGGDDDIPFARIAWGCREDWWRW
jgi:single-strand DNA-binding protein